MSHSIEKRIFLVGCPRSGTTLLQSLLAAHSAITSFPESHFLPNIVARTNKRRQRLGLASREAKQNFSEVLSNVEAESYAHKRPKVGLFVREYIQSFVSILDEMTSKQGKTIWLEKTPRHLHYIDTIERAVPNVMFIHIVRDGRDVVSSLFEVTHEHPEVWGGSRDIDTCISRWRQDIELSRQNMGKPNHSVIRYDELVENPSEVVKPICSFLRIPYEVGMLQNYRSVSERVLSPGESWKKSVQDPIQATNSRKFERLFNLEQQAYINREVGQIGDLF